MIKIKRCLKYSPILVFVIYSVSYLLLKSYWDIKNTVKPVSVSYPLRLNQCRVNDAVTQKLYPSSFITCSNNVALIGRPFDKTFSDILTHFYLNEHISLYYPWTDEQILNSYPVVVSGISENHVSEAASHIQSWINYLSANKSKIIIYNLGMSKRSTTKLTETFGDKIELRQFNFQKYPDYVGHLNKYRFKPLIVAEILRDYPSIIWLDSSIVIRKNFTQCFDSGTVTVICFLLGYTEDIIIVLASPEMFPVSLLSFSGHSIHAVTDPQMFQYLPMDYSERTKIKMYQAAPLIVYATKVVRFNFLRFLVWCALDVECMAPGGHNVHCDALEDRYLSYANCHRYDQSAINILLATINGYNDTKYFTEAQSCMAFDRQFRLSDFFSSLWYRFVML